MSHEIAVYGVAISVIFAFVRWAIPVMPKPVAWSGVGAGIIVLVADGLIPQMNITLPAIGLFLVDALCIGGAINLSLSAKPTRHDPVAVAPPVNRMGDVNNNTGVVTQGQRGDNAIGSK
jgi:hypothetical protein